MTETLQTPWSASLKPVLPTTRVY